MSIADMAAKIHTAYAVAGQRMAVLHKSGTLTKRKEGRLVIYRSAA